MLLTKRNIERELVDLSTAARLTGRSRQAISGHALRGNIEIVRAGAARLVWVRELQKILAAHGPGGRPPKVDLDAWNRQAAGLIARAQRLRERHDGLAEAARQKLNGRERQRAVTTLRRQLERDIKALIKKARTK